MGLARAFFDLKRWDDAIALTGNMLESDPESAQLWILQANAYIGLEKPMKAAENFEIVDRLGKATPDSLMLLGDIYLNSELFAPAVDVYLRVLEGEGQNSAGWSEGQDSLGPKCQRSVQAVVVGRSGHDW